MGRVYKKNSHKYHLKKPEQVQLEQSSSLEGLLQMNSPPESQCHWATELGSLHYSFKSLMLPIVTFHKGSKEEKEK